MKELVIVSKGRTTCFTCQEQLEHLLGNWVNITGYYLDGNIKSGIRGDVVLVTSSHILSEARRYIKPECLTIIARRSINYHEVGQLLEIPAGTDVLLVNDMPRTAYETIALLQALGIDHINYHPHAPGLKEYPRLKIAVTPGELDLVPDFIEKVINIKSRIIDITTLVEILDKLCLLDEQANLLSANYIRDIINLIKSSRQMAVSNNKIKNQLQTIINTVHDGIIATDDRKRISVFNPIAEELLGLRAEDAIGKKTNAITDKNILQIFNDEPEKTESFITVNSHHIVVNAADIPQDSQQSGRVYTFKDISEIQRLEEELRRKLVNHQNVARYTLGQIQGESEVIKATLAIARKMAASHSPILIQGESGTGKELLAQGIHNTSPRKNGPFVAVNFAALTESLLESELFGYDEGSFTGARRGGLAGLFEQAHKGTIFLDEIGDAPLPFQVKILRVLQEKQVRRIGSSRITPIDVRVIAATNRDLKNSIAKGLFRQDLYYRLNVLPIRIPPLRHRKQDILLLANVFYNQYFNKKPAQAAEEYFSLVAPYLLAYNWPGNIRELQNVLEYLINICPDKLPTPKMLPEELQSEMKIAIETGNSRHDIGDKVLREIAKANDRGIPAGRRSLAQTLAIPENTIRNTLRQLQEQGLITVRKGRMGLLAFKPD
ncbi:MAG: sigma 54-interacting transcriptional regulator [Anaerolineaceae bacterium]|nr:sigma 54-interacting transcriptional regulator [Anaerolineaceae bacterium]